MVARPLSSIRGRMAYPPRRARGLRGGRCVKSGAILRARSNLFKSDRTVSLFLVRRQAKRATNKRLHLIHATLGIVHVTGSHSAREGRGSRGPGDVVRLAVIANDAVARGAEANEISTVGVTGDLPFIDCGHGHDLGIGRWIKWRGHGFIAGRGEDRDL